MELALFGFAVLLFLSFCGFPLGFTTLLVGFVGFAYTREWNWEGAMNMGPIGVVLFVCAICIVLGMIFEAVGLLLLIVPVFLPTLQLMGVDMIWFGIIMVVVVEMGLITPPIGMNVFTVRAVMPDIKLGHIFKGVVPFVFADVIALALILIFPVIAIGLVELLR